MKRNELQEVIACLDERRRKFSYFKDQYALQLLQWDFFQKQVDRQKIQQLRQSDKGKLLNRPLLAELLKTCGDGWLGLEALQMVWQQPVEFVTTLDIWGDGDCSVDQTTRRQSNLVLQINFDGLHRQRYQQLVKPRDWIGPFEYDGHPICFDQRKTLAWVRLDFCLETGEALIEEIQNDWLRRAESWLKKVAYLHRRHRGKLPYSIRNRFGGGLDGLNAYMREELEPYKKVWNEAALYYALTFIRDELGIKQVYYHTFETGTRIKNVIRQPPRSMYTQLPRQFCFEEGDEVPAFVANDKAVRRRLKKIKPVRFYQLAI